MAEARALARAFYVALEETPSLTVGLAAHYFSLSRTKAM